MATCSSRTRTPARICSGSASSPRRTPRPRIRRSSKMPLRSPTCRRLWGSSSTSTPACTARDARSRRPRRSLRPSTPRASGAFTRTTATRPSSRRATNGATRSSRRTTACSPKSSARWPPRWGERRPLTATPNSSRRARPRSCTLWRIPASGRSARATPCRPAPWCCRTSNATPRCSPSSTWSRGRWSRRASSRIRRRRPSRSTRASKRSPPTRVIPCAPCSAASTTRALRSPSRRSARARSTSPSRSSTKSPPLDHHCRPRSASRAARCSICCRGTSARR
mmetsp:Transcript_20188/g.80583  ORF Transcript_20188/g.80583 Transcript_20188/m.80583 type:complete len:281 (-) Transcript_20188:992-1834(-)